MFWARKIEEFMAVVHGGKWWRLQYNGAALDIFRRSSTALGLGRISLVFLVVFFDFLIVHVFRVTILIVNMIPPFFSVKGCGFSFVELVLELLFDDCADLVELFVAGSVHPWIWVIHPWRRCSLWGLGRWGKC